MPSRQNATIKGLIIWKTRSVKPFSAAVRLRVIYPIIALQQRSWDYVAVEKDETVCSWPDASALIIVNSYRTDDVRLARRAKEANVPIVVDLCDNIFADDFSNNKAAQHHQENFLAIAALSSAVTVPSQQMKHLLAQHLPATANIQVMPDQLETPEETRLAFSTEWINHLMEKKRKTLNYYWKVLVRLTKKRPRKQHPEFTSAAKPPGRTNDRKRLIWFGHHGEFGKSGIISVVDCLPVLEKLNKHLPLELLIVSNNRLKYENLIAPASFPTHYVPWNPYRIFEDLRNSDAFIMPNSKDSFSISKSAGRAVLSLSLGVPVVATMIPSLESLRECIFSDITVSEVEHALCDEQQRARRTQSGKHKVAVEFSRNAAGERWDTLLQEITHSQPGLEQEHETAISKPSHREAAALAQGAAEPGASISLRSS